MNEITKQFKDLGIEDDLIKKIMDYGKKNPNSNTFMSWRSIRDDTYDHVLEGTINSIYNALSFNVECKKVTNEYVLESMIQILEEKDKSNWFGMEGCLESQAKHMYFLYTDLTKEKFDDMKNQQIEDEIMAEIEYQQKIDNERIIYNLDENYDLDLKNISDIDIILLSKNEYFVLNIKDMEYNKCVIFNHENSKKYYFNIITKQMDEIIDVLDKDIPF